MEIIEVSFDSNSSAPELAHPQGHTENTFTPKAAKRTSGLCFLCFCVLFCCADIMPQSLISKIRYFEKLPAEKPLRPCKKDFGLNENPRQFEYSK